MSRRLNLRDGMQHHNPFAWLCCCFPCLYAEHDSCRIYPSAACTLVSNETGFALQLECNDFKPKICLVPRQFGQREANQAQAQPKKETRQVPLAGESSCFLGVSHHAVGTDGGFLKISCTPGMGGFRVRNAPQVILADSSYTRSGPYLKSDFRISSHWTAAPL